MPACNRVDNEQAAQKAVSGRGAEVWERERVWSLCGREREKDTTDATALRASKCGNERRNIIIIATGKTTPKRGRKKGERSKERLFWRAIFACFGNRVPRATDEQRANEKREMA